MRPLLKNLEDQTIVVTGVASEMPGVHGPAGAARNQRGLALTRAQDLPGPGSPES